MAANDITTLTQEPLFYGVRSPGTAQKDDLSAEHFIQRVLDFKAKNTWNDATTASRAIS
jgi:hypothetical protein